MGISEQTFCRLLPLEEEVPGDGSGRSASAPGPGRGEPQAETVGGPSVTGQVDAPGRPSKENPEACSTAATGRLPPGGLPPWARASTCLVLPLQLLPYRTSGLMSALGEGLAWIVAGAETSAAITAV